MIRRAAALCLLLAVPAAAHDTWLAPRGEASGGTLRLQLGTGERYPTMETSVGRDPLVHAGCRFEGGEPVPLRVDRDTPASLQLSARGDPTRAHACWAQTPAHEAELEPGAVDRYLDEIRAGEAIRVAWKLQRDLNQPWRERFTKHARWDGGGGQPGLGTPMAMDAVPQALPLRPGQRLQLQLLRQGRPLPRLAAELVGAATGIGLWLRTDADGRIDVPVPVAGAWLLRATEVRPDPERPGRWISGFVTFSFTVDKE